MHSSAPCLNPQPAGAQSSLGSLVQAVMGVYFLTGFLETLQTSLGHLEHLVLVVYPDVSSSHFSSTSVLHSTSSSSCLVQHSDSYSVRQISGPWMSQSFTRGVLQTATVSSKAIFSYSMKQFFYKWSSTNCNSLIKSNLLIFNETVLPEVLLTFFLLLGLVVGCVSCVASLVVGVITLHHIIVLSFFHHLNFVNASFAICSRPSSCNCSKADINIVSLALVTSTKRLGWSFVSMLLMMPMMVIFCAVGIEWESVYKGLSISSCGCWISQLTSSKDTMSTS